MRCDAIFRPSAQAPPRRIRPFERKPQPRDSLQADAVHRPIGYPAVKSARQRTPSARVSGVRLNLFLPK
jgi:hypothetical protein